MPSRSFGRRTRPPTWTPRSPSGRSSVATRRSPASGATRSRSPSCRRATAPVLAPGSTTCTPAVASSATGSSAWRCSPTGCVSTTRSSSPRSIGRRPNSATRTPSASYSSLVWTSTTPMNWARAHALLDGNSYGGGLAGGAFMSRSWTAVAIGQPHLRLTTPAPSPTQYGDVLDGGFASAALIDAARRRQGTDDVSIYTAPLEPRPVRPPTRLHQLRSAEVCRDGPYLRLNCGGGSPGRTARLAGASTHSRIRSHATSPTRYFTPATPGCAIRLTSPRPEQVMTRAPPCHDGSGDWGRSWLRTTRTSRITD